MNDFRAVHLVFGVANLTKLLIKANAGEAAETLTWEARPLRGMLPRGRRTPTRENAALRRQCAAAAFSAYGGCYNGNGATQQTMVVGYTQDVRNKNTMHGPNTKIISYTIDQGKD
jgi:hypothetical protein